MPEFKKRSRMDKPKTKPVTISQKRAARILSEKYRRQLDQRPEGSESEATDATDKIGGAGRRAVGEVTSRSPRSSRSRNPIMPKESARHTTSPTIPRQETGIPNGLPHPQEAGRQAFVSHQQSRPKGQRSISSGENATTKPPRAGQRFRTLKERPRTVFKSKADVSGLAPGPAPKVKPAAKGAKTVQQITQRQMRQQAVIKAGQAAKAAVNAGKKAVTAIAKATSPMSSLMGLLGGGVLLVILIFIVAIAAVADSPFGIFFSGEDSGTGQTMPMAVREINQELEDRLEMLQSETPHDEVEISASQARWPEVLAVYAVRTTTDPDNGQEVASMDDGKKDLLKRIFWDMNEISYSVHTVSHETVTGAEETETTLYITVNHRTAWEMADVYSFNTGQREQLAELLSEENRSLWNSVLYGIGTGDGKIVIVALSQLGNRGGEPYWSWYGFNRHVEWCACFVSWCADQCGCLETGTFPRFSYCPDGIRWFKTAGLWQDRTFEPRPGDIIFFDWEGDGTSDHVGIVERVENGMIYTVEGNVDDTCKQCSYHIGDSCICGFGTPDAETESGN